MLWSNLNTNTQAFNHALTFTLRAKDTPPYIDYGAIYYLLDTQKQRIEAKAGLFCIVTYIHIWYSRPALWVFHYYWLNLLCGDFLTIFDYGANNYSLTLDTRIQRIEAIAGLFWLIIFTFQLYIQDLNFGYLITISHQQLYNNTQHWMITMLATTSSEHFAVSFHSWQNTSCLGGVG